MKLKHNQRRLVRNAAFFTLAILFSGVANVGACGQGRDETPKKVSTSREPSAGSNAASAIMTAQAPLVRAAEQIQKLDASGTGLGGIRLQVDMRTLEVWWRGEPPETVRKEIARQERKTGIKVVVQSAQYSQKELIETARNIISKAKEYPGLVSAGPLVDASGLEIGVTDTERASSFKFPTPVRVVSRKGIVPLYSRGDDSPPWWAGAVTRPAVNDRVTCSTGFAMAQGSTHGILTAEHCFCGGGVNFTNGVGVPIGPAELASTRKVPTDSLFVVGDSGPATYDGGVGVGEFSKPVVGSSSNFAGMGVCTSGAATGVHCNIFIDITGLVFTSTCSGESFIQGVSLATQVDGGVAAGSGDSGGPVFTLTGPDNSQVKAAGIISVGSNPTPCQGFGTDCFNQVGFTDIDSLESSHGASVMTTTTSTGGGGATITSMLVFGGATFIWTLAQMRRRAKSQPQRLCSK